MFSRIRLSLSANSKSSSHSRVLLLLYILGIGFFAVLVLLVQRSIASDDYAFQTQIQPYQDVWEWVAHRYVTWSGRIFAESFVYIFSPLPLIFWKIVTIVSYAVFSGMLFLYYKIYTKKRSNKKDYLMLTLSVCLPLLIPTYILTDSTLWVTGAMNYFWIASIALVAFYPIVYYVFRRKPAHWAVSTIAGISAFIASSSQEQIGATLVVLALFFTAYIIYRTHKIPYYLLGFCFILSVCFAVGILAPGNDNRVQMEAAARLPDFYTISIINHLDYACRWILEAIVNTMGPLLLACWILLLGLFVVKSHYSELDKLDKSVVAVLTVATLFMCLKSAEIVSYWFNFYATWHAHPAKFSYVPVLAWISVLFFTAAAPLILYRKNVNGLLMSILICAAFASTAIVTLSPTMYASGYRTLYVPSLLLLITSYVLLNKIYSDMQRYTTLIILGILTLSLSHYIFLVKFLLDK